MRVIYLCHPLAGPDRALNRANAAAWAGWICQKFDVAIIADWLVLSSVWPETNELRARGLAIDVALVARADEVWMVGGRVSSGMAIEVSEATKLGKPVLDLTRWGYVVPDAGLVEERVIENIERFWSGSPRCNGCECGVALVDGRHEEETDIPGTVYAYPCLAAASEVQA